MSKTMYKNPIAGFESRISGPLRDYNYGQCINGGIDFGQSTETNLSNYSGNMKGQWVNVTAPNAPDTEFAVPHSLGYVPSHYPIVNSDISCRVYQLPNTGTAWTNTNIYLKCDVANANLRIFIQ